MAGLEGKRDGLSSRNWDDRQLLNMVESVLRRFFRSYWNLDAMTRSQVDRLRMAAAAAASNSIISALERRAVLTGFLDDVASIDAALPIIEEAMRDDVAGNGPGYATPKGISYLQALNLLRIMRDDPAHYVPRSLQTPRSASPRRAGRLHCPVQANCRGRVVRHGAIGRRARNRRPRLRRVLPEAVRWSSFYTYVDFPPTISNSNDVKYPLVVQLVRDRPRESRSEGEVGIAFKDETEYVDVVVRAPGFEEVSGYGAGARDGPRPAAHDHGAPGRRFAAGRLSAAAG